MKHFKILFFLIILQSCHEKKTEPSRNLRMLSREDSIKLNGYILRIDKLPLFSIVRQDYLDSILTILPKYTYAWQQKAMPLFKQKKYELGMNYLDSAVKYDSTSHYLEYRAFIKCIFQKSYRSSILDFENLQKINGNCYVMDHTYEFYKGLCYLQLNKFDIAERLFSKSISEDSLKLGKEWINCSALFYQGICFYEKQSYKKAIGSFDEAIFRYSRFSDAKYYKAICLEGLNNRKEALKVIKEAEKDFIDGYSIPETNAIYETYPYQINKFLINGYKNKLEGVTND